MASQAVLELLVELKDQASAGLSAIGGSLGAIGVVAGGAVVAGLAAAGSAAFSFASEAAQGVNDLQSSLGLTRDEAEDLGAIATEVFANNWGDSLTDVNQGIITVRQQMKGLGDEDLSGATAAAFALRDTFGIDLPESTNAANTLMKNFGLTSQQAFDFIAKGQQAGLDASGDFLDTIGEYSVQFADSGATAEQFFSTLQTGMAGGVLGTDKIADAFKESRIRIMELSDDVVDAFAAIGDGQAKALEFGGSTRGIEALDLLRQKAAELGLTVSDDLALGLEQGATNFGEAYSSLVLGGLEEGAISVAEIQQIAIDGLGEMENQVRQNTAGVAIFGTQWEDATKSAILGVDTTTTSLEDMAGATDSLNAKYNNWGSMWEGIKRQALVAIAPIGDGLLDVANKAMPTFSAGLSKITDLFALFANAVRSGDFGPLVTRLQGIASQIVPIFTQLAQKAATWIAEAIPPFLARAGEFARAMADWVNASLPGWVRELGKLSLAAVQWIVNALPGLGANLGRVYNSIITWVVNSLPGWVSQLQRAGMAFIQWVIDALPGLGTNLGRFAGQLLGWIVQTAIDVVPKLAVLAGKFLAWVAVEVLPKLPGILATIATGLYNFISAVAQEVGPKLAVLAAKFLDWVKTDVLPRLPGVLAGIAAGIATWVSDTARWAGSELLKVGQAIVDGIKGGISNAWDGFMGWIRDQVEKIPEPIRDALGISSPSRVMALLVGRPIVEGIVEGIYDAFPLIDNAMAGLEDQFVQPLRAIRDLAQGIIKEILDANVNTTRQTVDNFDNLIRITEQAQQASDTATAAWVAASKAMDEARASGDSTKLAEAQKAFEEAEQARIKAANELYVATQARNTAAQQLAEAEAQAAEISKTNAQAGAEYLAMRSQQIFELIDLENKRRLEESLGNLNAARVLAEKIELVRQAHAAEIAQYDQHASELARRMAEQAAEIARLGAESGDGFIAGVIAGISGQTQALSDAMVSAVTTAIDTMRRALGIASPSRLMELQIGIPMMQGLAAGIVGGTPMAMGAMANATAQVASAGQTTNNYYSFAYETRQSSGSVAQDVQLLSLLYG